MKALFFGGTGFVGRHLVSAWRALGHEATLFNRGRSDPSAFPDAEWIAGDRETDLAALGDRRWDVVFDTCGYTPKAVRASALATAGAKYVFVSTVSVYADLANTDEETGPLKRVAGAEDLPLAIESYGELKVACEDVLPPGALVARAGLLEGPHDYDARFRYWLTRIARGGEVLAPGDPEALVQLLDARDLAAWLVKSTALGGAFNLLGRPFTMRTLLETIRDVVESDARFTWVPDDVLLAHQVQPYSEMPFWLPAQLGARPVPVERAFAAGLTTRPLAETIGDTWEWLATGWETSAAVRDNRAWRVTAGIDDAREKDILADSDLRRALSGPEPGPRLRAAWALGARACTPELAAAWAIDALPVVTDDAEPPVEHRCLFPMALIMARELGALAVLAEHDPDAGVRASACQVLARAAALDDAVTYAVLSRVAGHDPSEEVRASVAANIREDAPEDVRRALAHWMRDGSVRVERAAVEAVFATSESPAAFLHRMQAEPVRRLQVALTLLRKKGITVQWSDVGKRMERRSFPILLELAHLFATRPEAPPLSFWLRCVTHMPEVFAEAETTRNLVTDAMVAAFQAASPETTWDAEGPELLHRALTVLADLLPKVAHASYLELRRAGAIPYPSSGKPKPVESGLARLWLAIVRLSPRPGDYVLKPRYR